ncbi:MAG: YraN family protein [Arachnia sp.]
MAINPRAAALGVRGEDIAAQHLEALGWRIIERNWRCPSGELDIIAWDQCAGAIVFVEVKSRSSAAFGDPLEAVTWRKQAKLRELAILWLRMTRPRVRNIRLDAIGVLLPRGSQPEVTHVRGIGA